MKFTTELVCLKPPTCFRYLSRSRHSFHCSFPVCLQKLWLLSRVLFLFRASRLTEFSLLTLLKMWFQKNIWARCRALLFLNKFLDGCFVWLFLNSWGLEWGEADIVNCRLGINKLSKLLCILWLTENTDFLLKWLLISYRDHLYSKFLLAKSNVHYTPGPSCSKPD